MTTHPTAREVIDLLDRGWYVAPSGTRIEIGAAHRSSVTATTLVPPDMARDLLAGAGPGGKAAMVSVIDATTQQAAFELAARGMPDPVLLNFASARNPGGGFLGGARAQEEDLCRCSGLYPTLLTQPQYYEANRRQDSLLYTDHLIHSPGVVWFRTRGDAGFLERPFVAAVITAPAPNSGPFLERHPGEHAALEATFHRRWGAVLALAEAKRHRTLVLGAWGCGAFRGDPAMAARTVEPWLTGERFAGAFDHVVFAIPSTGGQSRRNLEVFRAVLGAT